MCVTAFGLAAGCPRPAWVLLYTGAYVVVLGVLALVDFLLHNSDPSVAGFLVGSVFAAYFMVPFSIVPFAAMLSVLWLLRHTRPWRFRLAAPVLCCVPSVCTTDAGMLVFYLPAQLLLAVIIRQPHSTADDDPVVLTQG